MSKAQQTKENYLITKAQFDTACALIYLDFQNAPDLKNRLCVRRITAWDKVYFVQFYWGKPALLSKHTYFSNTELFNDTGFIREFKDPYLLKKYGFKKPKLPFQADLRWNKDIHLKWLDDHKLEIHLFWARKKYEDLGDTEDVANIKANYELLGIEPFSSPEMVKKAYHQQAKIFHPDLGGNIKNFLLIQKAYKVIKHKIILANAEI